MQAGAGTVTSFDLDAKLGTAGRTAALFKNLSEKFWHQPHIPAEILELCRLDLALMHRASAELALRRPEAAGVAPTKIAAVLDENWRKDASFSTAEKAALNFTEYYFMDPQSIPDDCADGVVGHFGESGLVCLIEALGFIDSRIRLALMFSALNG